MTAKQLRALCLGLPDAVEEFPFNDPEVSVFKVGGKVFAIAKLASRPLKVSVKCDPDRAFALRTHHRGVAPGYHLNKRHWITVDTGSDVPPELVRQLIEDSYDLVQARSRSAAAR